jgi:hypothetical protein
LLPVPPASAHYTEQPVLAEQDANDLQVSLDILMSARILHLQKSAVTMFTALGWAFMKACQPPEK